MNENAKSIIGFYDTNIKVNCERKWIHPGVTFSNYRPDFSKTLKTIKISTYSKKTVPFMRKIHGSVLSYSFDFWDLSDIWTLFVVTPNFTLVWRRRTPALGASRRQTRVDFLRASAPLARGRWWEWQIAANFSSMLVARLGVPAKSRRNVSLGWGGDDFERCVFMGALGMGA